MMIGRPLLTILCAAVLSMPRVHAMAAPSGLAIDVIHYDARIEPDLAAKAIQGTVTITFAVRGESQDWVELDRGDLAIDSVREEGSPQAFSLHDRRVRIQLSRPARAGDTRTVDIAYHGAPRSGIRIFPERGQVYTVFSTSQWLVCVDAPEDKATLRLQLILTAEDFQKEMEQSAGRSLTDFFSTWVY